MKEFFEEYGLYRKLCIGTFPLNQEDILASINYECEECDQKQTFAIDQTTKIIIRDHRGYLYENIGDTKRVEYVCAGCDTFSVEYFLVLSKKDDKYYVEKVGQSPMYIISIEKDIEKYLGEEVCELYKKGQICEQHSYGIAAFIYYRRVLEHVVDKLLDYILENSQDEDTKKDIKKIKAETIAGNRLDKVKDILPISLMIEGNNPLKILYNKVSEGIHAKTDGECLSVSVDIKDLLNIIIKKIIENEVHKKGIKEIMKKIT